MAVLAGTLLGVLAARRQGGPLDRTVSALAYTLEAAPAFWLGLLAIWFFSVRLGALPSGGLTDAGSDTVTAGQVASHLVLPALVLGVSQLPGSSSTSARAWPTPWPRTPYAEPARADSPSAASCSATRSAPACCPC